MDLYRSTQPLIDRARLHARIGELAAALDDCLAGRELLVLVVLKGSVPFSVDLMRQLHLPLQVDYVRARSYSGTESRGDIVFTHLPETALKDRHVLVVEDILDTGNTAVAILDVVKAQHPASITLVSLLDKPARRTREVEADFVGFTIGDQFVVGYGLDYNERYRELDAIYTLEP